MRNIVAALKGITFLICLITYLLNGLWLLPLFKINQNLGRKIANQLVSFYCKICCAFMQIDVRIDKSVNTTDPRNKLIVCNHLGYLDMLVIASNFPTAFVTSQDMREMPVLGQIAEVAGCVFVERRKERRAKGKLSEEILDITNSLKSGMSVLVFPEATSTNGSEVKRFKRPLFKASQDAGVEILPLCLNYTHINNEKVNLKNRDKIFWYGDMTFSDHLWGVFKQSGIKVRLSQLDSIKAVEEEDFSRLAEMSHEKVSSEYQPILA